VQTLPLWIPIVLGFRGSQLAKWAALPCLLFWLVIMIFIWLFLLGWTRIVSGHFSPVEIAMTIAVGMACLGGILVGLRWRTKVHGIAGWGIALGAAVFQIAAFRVSLIPFIAKQ
jgi:hypothetical protein